MLLVGLALRPLPVGILSRLAAHFLQRIEQHYPEISPRLGPLGLCIFHIIPTDLRFSFLITLNHGQATVKVMAEEGIVPDTTATISGDMLSFIQLLEGRVDGDALFFSRRLVVEGDTEAVLTLRNAVDSVDLSVEHILAGMTGPMKPMFRALAPRLSALHQTAHKDFDLINRSLTEHFSRKISQLEEDLDRQEERFIQQGKEIRKMQAALKRNGTAVRSN